MITFKQWLEANYPECDGVPHKPRKMKKINHKEKVSSGVRKGAKDLSADYKGNIEMNGDIEPWKSLSVKGKSAAPVA